MTVPSIITGNSITVLVAGKTLVAKTSHPNFEAIKAALKAGAPDPAKLASLFDIAKAVEAKSAGKVKISGNVVTYDGQPLHNTLTTRMIAMLTEGFSIDPLVNFLERLMQNPSHRAVNGLYDFLAATNIPITPEGNFLAYKKVRSTYFDIHSNTMRNAPGDVLSVPRNRVDEDPDRTCSYGLHVCSMSYLAHFGSSGGSDRVVIVEVNPADVVAIPRDYNNAKMRVAGYKVVGEVAPSEIERAFTATVVSGTNYKPGNAAPVDTMVDVGELSADETDVIRSIAGVAVRFVWIDDGEWEISYTGEDGEEREGVAYGDTIDEAVEDFEADLTEEVVDFTAEVRWLDEDGELQIEKVTVTALTDDGEPMDYVFLDALLDDEDSSLTHDDAEVARVVNITEVPGTTRLRLI